MLQVKKEKKLKPYKKRKRVKEENFFDNQPQLMSLLAPEVIQEKRDYIYMGDDKYARIFTLMVYPNYIEIGWLDDILNTIGDVDISTQVQVADERNVIKYLTHKVTKLQSDYLLFERQGNIEELHRLEENIQAFEEMRRNIQINNDKMFFIKITLRVNAESLKELNEKSKMLRDEFANRSCEIRPLYFKQLDALKETLPLNNNILNDNNRNMTTRGLAAMFPIARTKSSTQEGIYLGRDLFTGLPMNLETFCDGLANANIAIFGVPGAGKSVTVKTIVGRSALINRRSSILDIEGEYVQQTEKLGGRIIKVRQSVPVGINLFDIDIDEDEGFIDIDSKVTEIRAIINGIINKYENRTLKPYEIADIEQAVKEVYREKEITKDIHSIYEKEGGKIEGKITFGNIKKKMPTLTDFHRVMKQKIGNEELANRGIGMGAAMGYTVRSIAYQFKGENANKTEGNDFISRVVNRASTKTQAKPIEGVSYESHSSNIMENTKPINQTNITNKTEQTQNTTMAGKENKQEIPNQASGFKKAFNVGKEFMNLGMYMAEGRNFKTNENNMNNKRMYNRPNINNTRKEDIEESTNKIISIEQDDNND